MLVANLAWLGEIDSSGGQGADLAALVTIAPCAYTLRVNGTSGGGGFVLVEIYDLP